jgi:hypothetical protein
LPDRQSPEERLRIAERQRDIWKLHVVRKLTISEIAGIVGISVPQVSRDLGAVRRRGHTLLKRTQAAEDAVFDAGLEACTEFDAITRQAWSDCMAAPEGSATRARFLNVVLKSIEQRVKILQSLGLMEKVPEEVLLGGIDLRQLSDSEVESALAFIRACSAGAGGGTDGSVGIAAQPAPVD